MAKIKVKQPEEPTKEITTEILASSIVSIAEGVRKLRTGRLNDKALMLLIQHAAPNVNGRGYSPLSIKQIKAVLDGMESLETTYIRKTNKTKQLCTEI